MHWKENLKSKKLVGPKIFYLDLNNNCYVAYKTQGANQGDIW